MATTTKNSDENNNAKYNSSNNNFILSITSWESWDSFIIKHYIMILVTFKLHIGKGLRCPKKP